MSEASAPQVTATPFDLSTVAPDDRERLWHQHYYQGDHVPQLTVRAVLVGGMLGMVMSISNLYTTLKLGWSFGVAITACVLSYAIWNTFVGLRWSKSQMTILENNCMQSTASAAGVSTGGTLATAVGALLLIGGDEHRMGWIPVTAWVFLTAALGVFLAIPMKRQMINIEQLPFPSGIAAAETLRSLYAKGEEAVHKARALLGTLFAGGVLGLARSFEFIPDSIKLPGIIATIRGQTFTASMLGMTFEPSLLLIAAGMIVGLRVSASMLFGALVNWLILTPQVLGMAAWSGHGKHFFGQIEVKQVTDAIAAQLGVADWFVPGKMFFGSLDWPVLPGDHVTAAVVTRWSLWLGTALMVTSGLTSFALGWRTIVRAFSGLGSGRSSGDAAMDRIEVPAKWMVLGGIPVTVGLMLLCWISFGIAPWLGLLSVFLSFVLALVACRATGETDTTPIGAMGKITQFIYAVLSPADKTINLMTAGITAGAAGSSADLLTDLKSGYLLGANPRKQFVAQFLGVFFGVLAVVPAWYLMVPNKKALEAFNPPATNMWHAVAEALSSGVQTITESARYAIVVGAFIGILLPILEFVFPKSRRFLPSSMGLGLAFVVSFANSLSFFIGAVIAALWIKRSKETGERFIVPLASGAIAGESLAAATFAILNSLHLVG